MVEFRRYLASRLKLFCLPVLVCGALGLIFVGPFGSSNRQAQTFAQVAPVVNHVDDSTARAEEEFHNKITPLLQTYCYLCHGDGQDTGGLALDSYKTAASITRDAKTWDTLYRYVRSHQMPPSTEPQPTDEERKLIAGWVDQQLNQYYARHPDPGRVTIHRLNRVEYNNTIRDLVGLDIHPADEFPMDDSGYGFDNIADVLSLPPMLMEKYMAAANKVMDQAIVTEQLKDRVNRIPASLAEVAYYSFGDRGDGWVRLNSGNDGYAAMDVSVPDIGEYAIRVLAFARRDGNPGLNGGSVGVGIQGDGALTASLQLNDTVIQDVPIVEDEAHPKVYEARVVAPAGKQRFQVVVHHYRGGDNEDVVSNAKIGRDQPGPIFIKYIEIEGPFPYASHIYSASQLQSTGLGQNLPNGSRVLKSGDVSVPVELTRDGEVTLRARATAIRAGDGPAVLELRVDGRPIDRFDVYAPAATAPQTATPGQGRGGGAARVKREDLGPIPRLYEIHAQLPPGKHLLSAAFANPFNDPTNPDPSQQERAIIIDSLQVVNQTESLPRPRMPSVIAELFRKHGAAEEGQPAPTAPVVSVTDVQSSQALAAARGIIGDFALRAWRSPASAGSMDRLMDIYHKAADAGETFEGSVKLAMKGILVSPHFIFRTGPRDDRSDPGVHPIGEYALASRLSYFLWSTTPDDELLDLAGRGQLRSNLAAQIRRMLGSPKAQALVENFGGQWLQFRTLEQSEPDKSFAKFDPALKAAMKKEPELLFNHIMRQDRSIIDFINADYTFVNERLADFYGIKGVSGDDFQKVSLIGTPRRGVLTEGSTLMLTSNPTRTSPVKRGKWVLENILGAPPPPPPPNVPPLDDSRRQLVGSLRQQLEQHRANPACASCHAIMDPIGFGLENFDAIGDYRAADVNQARIDSSGTLITGESFSGATDLANVFGDKHREDFINCLSEKMLTYALGRGVEYYDRGAMDQIVDQVEKENCSFSSLIRAVVNSLPFQMERGDTETAAR